MLRGINKASSGPGGQLDNSSDVIGQVSSWGRCEVGRQTETWYSWHRNGGMSESVEYFNGLHHGQHKTWCQDGQLQTHAQYRSGQRIGQINMEPEVEPVTELLVRS